MGRTIARSCKPLQSFLAHYIDKMSAKLPPRQPVLPQAISRKDPAKDLKLFQRFDRENNVLPLEPYIDSFRRQNAWAPHEIVPGLYLSNIKTAAHYLLGFPQGKCSITHMLSIIQIGSTVRFNLPEPQGEGVSIKRLILNRKDKSSQNILQDFDHTSAFIHEAVQRHKNSEGKDGGILVHCFAGISRSASLVIAYLLKHPENIPPAEHACSTLLRIRHNLCDQNVRSSGQTMDSNDS